MDCPFRFRGRSQGISLSWRAALAGGRRHAWGGLEFCPTFAYLLRHIPIRGLGLASWHTLSPGRRPGQPLSPGRWRLLRSPLGVLWACGRVNGQRLHPRADPTELFAVGGIPRPWLGARTALRHPQTPRPRVDWTSGRTGPPLRLSVRSGG